MDAAARDPRVQVHSTPWIEDEDYQFFFGACDAVVFPFKSILTSGSVMLALSFGKPVVVPRLGCLPDLVDDSMGVLYDPDSPDGLAGALKSIIKKDLAPLGRNAMARAQAFDWGDIGRQTAEVYADILGKPRAGI